MPTRRRVREVVLTNSRVWANVPPPFRPKTVISFPNDRRAISVPDGGFGAPRLMSTNNRILVMIGLSVVGSLGWAHVRDPADWARAACACDPCAAAAVTPGTIPAADERTAHPGRRLREGTEISSTSESA